DLIILDLSLPGMGGIELTRRILQRHPEAHILIFSMHRDPLFAAQALRAGALGYVTKSSSPDVLIQAVYKIARREKVLSPDIAPEMALTLLEGTSNPAEELSPREFEILRLLLDGRGNEEIGNILNLSPKTVQNVHYQIKTKLGVRTDIELARLAMKLKLIG
uniref:response regulator transcription factor n=1 Tax=Zoogloea sp. TaxID=49181 RepID=UPI00322034E0